MADENTTTAPTSTSTSTDETKNEPADEVKLTKEEHAQLLEKAKAADEVALARRVFAKDATEEQRVEAMATLMASAGYSDEEIIAHLSEEEEVPAEENRRQPARQSREEPDPVKEQVAALQAQIEALQKRTDTSRVKSLEDMLSREVGDRLTKGELRDLIQVLGEGRKESEQNDLQGTLRGDILEETKRLLRQKRDQFGEFREDWIPEAATQAADKVAKKVRAYGGANRVGRSQELDLAEDELLKSPPKTLPKEAPRSSGDVDKVIDDYATDMLIRAAAEAGRGGKTQV